jgi:hypothetical protein
MSELSNSNARMIAIRDLSPMAFAIMGWLRSVARALRAFRLYRGDNPVVLEQRTKLITSLQEIAKSHGMIDLRITPSEIYLVDEAVVKPSPRSDDGIRMPEELLPFQIYRDGIRRLLIQPDVTPAEVGTLIDALRTTGVGPDTQDDLVTLLWQGNLTRIQLESVPLEQTIYLSVHRGEGGGGSGQRAQSYAWSPAGTEIRATIGQATGAQGLHRDTFDDWSLAVTVVDPVAGWAELAQHVTEARAGFLARWEAERAEPWTAVVPRLMHRMLEADPGDDMRNALTQSIVTWLASALQHSEWIEAQQALGLLRELDPDGARGNASLDQALSGLDMNEIAERLDESDPEDHARFSALVVAIGAPALDLACTVLCMSNKIRPRAAASTALTFLCNDHPEMLAPYLVDSRWTMVRNVVFVLGQIGGSAVTPLLRTASDHHEVRVRRAVVQALGGVPREERTPILLQQLETRDPQLLAAALNMLTRERNPRVARAILDRIEAPDFESRNEDNQRALFNALSEMADDSVVPRLHALIHKGGWFARRTLERVAAARVLRRLATEKSMAALETGLRSKSEIVRAACLEAMSQRMAS